MRHASGCQATCDPFRGPGAGPASRESTIPCAARLRGREPVTVRFATFNVEDLFARPRAFNQATWAQVGRSLTQSVSSIR